MANLLQSSQTQATTAPSFYTDYLSKVSQAAQGMLPGQENAPQYVGAQPLQTQAFQNIAQTANAYQPMVGQGAELVGQAGAQDIAGAAQPYLAAGTGASPLAAMAPFAQRAISSGGLGAAQPYLATAALNDPSMMAQQYMNPFVQSAVQSMSDIAQRNIQQNLAPQATAAAVGSGQFGSQRGAQVLGQVERQAEQDLNSQIAQMMSSGYGQALQAAGQQQALLGQLGATAGGLGQQQANLLGQLGGTAATAQQAQNAAQLQAAQTASNAAAQQAAAQQAAGLGLGSLGTQGSALNLANINALATLGGQQQTIAQNQQMFPLTTLSNLAGILQGYNMPQTVTTQLQSSPLSALAGIGAGIGGLFQTPAGGGNSLFSNLTGYSNLPAAFQGWFGNNPYSQSGTASTIDAAGPGDSNLTVDTSNMTNP